MFKTIIGEQRKRLEGERKSLENKIDEIDKKISALEEERKTLHKQFDDMALSKEDKEWYIEALNTRISLDKSELEQQKDAFKTTELEKQFKATLKNELRSSIENIADIIAENKKEESALRENLRKTIVSGDLSLISGLNDKMSEILSAKDELSKLLSNLKDIENSFDDDTYEEVVAKMEKVEKLTLITDTGIIEAPQAAPENGTDDVATPVPIKDISEEEYNNTLKLLNEVEEKLDKLLKADVETIISSNNNLGVKGETIEDYYSKVEEFIKDNFNTPNVSKISEKLDTIKEKYDEYIELKDLITEIIKNIDELKNNMLNFSKQKYVDTARQILSKIELLEDEELKNDLTKQLKLVEFGRTNNESNDNSDLEELKEKFRKIYSSKERAMLTDVVIDFDDIENLAAQFEDEFSKNSAYACIDNLKDLYELSGKVSMKIKNDEITPDNGKEITDLLYEIKKISSVVYGGLNEQFEKRKKEFKVLEDSKIVSFFKKPSTAATGTKENPQGFIPEGTFDDLEDEFTHPENNSEEEERKIFEELENEINHTSFDKLENLRKEVDSAKISKDKALKLNMLIGSIKNQLEKIDATSEALKKNIDLISLEKFADKNEIQGMLDNFNKYVDSIKVIYEIVKSNPTDSVIAKEYDKLVDTFVEFNNKVSTKFNIEKFRIKPKSRYCNFKYNDGNVILRLSRERIEEKGYKELFVNTEKILNAKNIISELQVKIRLDGFGSLKGKMFDKTKKYNKAVNDICEDLIEMLNNEIKELEKDNFTLIPTKAFDSWILMLSIMPNSIEVKQKEYARGYVTELVSKYASMIKNVIEKSNDESLKKQLGKDNIDLDAWYSTIAAISLYKKEHDYFDFKDESAFEDDVTLYADHSSVLHGIKYMDPETKVRNLYK